MPHTKNNTSDHTLAYWIILIVLFLTCLVLGAIGFRSYFIIHGEEYNFGRYLYRALQLFTFEGGDIQQPIPCLLQLIRFFAPFITILAVIGALWDIIMEQRKRIKIARLKNHIVIIGFGKKGRNVLQNHLKKKDQIQEKKCKILRMIHNFLKKKDKILVIDIDPHNPLLDSIKSRRSFTIIGDATQPAVIKKSRITEAKSVYLLMGDDTSQVNTCLLIYQLIEKSDRDDSNALDCIMHLRNQEFLYTMRSHNLAIDTKDGLTVSIFNVYENSARVLFEENPPDHSGISRNSDKYVQIIIIGFGQAGEALALQTAQTGHYLNGKKPHVLIIDRLAAQKIPDFLRRYPTYNDYCDLLYLAMDADSPQLIQHLSPYFDDPRALTTMVLCLDNSTHNMMIGKQLENLKEYKEGDPPWLFVRINDDETYKTFPEEVNPYGLPSITCSDDVIRMGKLDTLGVAFHYNYLIERAIQRMLEHNLPRKESEKSWQELSQEYKDSNRRAADHIGVKVRAIGYEITDIVKSEKPIKFPEDAVENLAILEHKRWYAERSLAGWTYGKEDDPRTRKNQNLVDWKNLPESVKEYDRSSVRNIPYVLMLVGKTIKKI